MIILKTVTAIGAAIAVLLLFSCSKNTNEKPGDVIPDTGMYLSVQFAPGQLQKINEVPYSKRPNYMGMQYTSEKTKAAERQQAELTMKMNIILPPNASASQRQPLIIFVHGGGFVGGDKDNNDVKLEPYALAGYVTSSINYRLTADNGATPALRLKAITDAQEDAQNAIRFLKANADKYFIDTTRVCMMGGSAGGATTLIAAVEFDAPLFKSDFPNISAKTQAAISSGATLINDDPASSPGLLHFDRFDTPILLFHAKETDASTGATWTNNVLPTQKVIQQSGNECTVVAQPNMTHVIDMALGKDYWPHIKPFLWKNLRLQ